MIAIRAPSSLSGANAQIFHSMKFIVLFLLALCAVLEGQPQPKPSFGPNGTHWPNLVPTPWAGDLQPNEREVDCTWDAIRSAVSSLTDEEVADGVAIRVRPGILTGNGFGSSSPSPFRDCGKLSWSKRVLICPRDGYGTVVVRGGVRYVNIPKLAIMGFDYPEGVNLSATSFSAIGWGFAKFGKAIGDPKVLTENNEIVEMVFGTENEVTPAIDRFNVSTNGAPYARTYFIGCYFAPVEKRGGPNPSSAKSLGIVSVSGKRVSGTGFTKVGARPEHYFKLDRDSDGTWTQIESVSDSKLKLEARYPNEAEGEGKVAKGYADHTDTLQFGHANGGTYSDMYIIDCALFSSSNCAVQVGSCEGVTIRHTYICGMPWAAARYPYLQGGTQRDRSAVVNGGGARHKSVDNVFLGTDKLVSAQDPRWDLIENTRVIPGTWVTQARGARKGGVSYDARLSENNTWMPPLPDEAYRRTVWDWKATALKKQ